MTLIGESSGLGRLTGLRRHTLLRRTRPAGELLFELAQAARPILKLASALTRRNHDAARNMAHAHRGIRGIHALTSGSRCPKSLDIAIASELVDRYRRPFAISFARNPRIIHFERPLPATRHGPTRPTQKDGLEPLMLQPSEHVAMNLVLDGLVQDLMAHAGVKLLGHALNARLAIHLRRAVDAGAALAHRVALPGDQEQRQGVRHLARETRIRRIGDEAREDVICAHGELLPAQ